MKTIFPTKPKFKMGERMRCTISHRDHDDAYPQGTITEIGPGEAFTVTWDHGLPDYIRKNFFPKDIVSLDGWEDFLDKINDRIK